MLAFEDNDLTPQEKQLVLLQNLYVDVPPNMAAATRAAVEFLNGGAARDGSGPRSMLRGDRARSESHDLLRPRLAVGVAQELPPVLCVGRALHVAVQLLDRVRLEFGERVRLLEQLHGSLGLPLHESPELRVVVEVVQIGRAHV